MATLIIAGVISALIIVAVPVFVRRTFVVVTVRGPSMEPSLRDGDRLLARRATGRLPAVGALVAFAPLMENGRPVPASMAAGGRLWLIKRLVAGPGDPVPPGLGPALCASAGQPVPDGHMVVVGDNSAQSVDSRQEGFVAVDRIRAVGLRQLVH